MGKKSKYFLSVRTHNLKPGIIPLTKKSFADTYLYYYTQIQMNHVRLADEKDPAVISEFFVRDIVETKVEEEKYIKTIYTISDGDTDIELIQYDCKPGYEFGSEMK